MLIYIKYGVRMQPRQKRKLHIDGLVRATMINYRATDIEIANLNKLADDYNCTVSRILEKAILDLFKKEKLL